MIRTTLRSILAVPISPVLFITVDSATQILLRVESYLVPTTEWLSYSEVMGKHSMMGEGFLFSVYHVSIKDIHLIPLMEYTM